METICKELYEDEVEESRHLFVMRDLARGMKVPLEEIIEPYEKSLKKIKETAKVRDYIVLLVIRDVKEALREKSAHQK